MVVHKANVERVTPTRPYTRQHVNYVRLRRLNTDGPDVERLKLEIQLFVAFVLGFIIGWAMILLYSAQNHP